MVLNSSQKIIDYSNIIDNPFAYEALKYSLSFYNFYQLKNLSMKISNCVFKDQSLDQNNYVSSVITNNNNNTNSNNNTIEAFKFKKHLTLENSKQKVKLQKLVSLVLSKLNSDSLNDLRTYFEERMQDI
jgi:hypothetical protein